MYKIKKILILIPIFVMFIMPVSSFAQTNPVGPTPPVTTTPPVGTPLDKDNGGLVPCGNEVYPNYTYKKDKDGPITKDGVSVNVKAGTIYELSTKPEKTTDSDLSGQVKNPCGFDHIMILINKAINFVLFVLALPIAAIMFAYAGFLLLFSGGESGKKTKAKNIFTNVAIGVIIAVIAWLAVELILSLLGYDGAWIGF